MGLTYWQINLQHSRDATACLARQLSKMDGPVIVAAQEPYFGRSGKIVGLPSDVSTHFLAGNPRAALFARGVHLWADHGRTTRDVACAVVATDVGNLRFASVYLDITVSEIPREVVDLVDVYPSSVVLGMDTNAHSIVWGCDETNDRGEMLEDFFMPRRLAVLNVGRKPTFVTCRAQSIIDVTICSSDLAGRIRG